MMHAHMYYIYTMITTPSSHRVIDTAKLVPRPVTVSLTQQTSYHVQSQSRWHIKTRTTSSHRAIDTANLVPRRGTEPLTEQTLYHVQQQSLTQQTS